MEENTDRTFTTKIQETITLTDQHDGFNITCSVRYPVNEGKHVKTAEEQKTLCVSCKTTRVCYWILSAHDSDSDVTLISHITFSSDAPKNTSVSISPSGLVSAGSWVNLSCSSRAKPPVSRFTWFKNSKDGTMMLSEGHVYSFNVTDGGLYHCVATNDLGKQASSIIQLNIKGKY